MNTFSHAPNVNMMEAQVSVLMAFGFSIREQARMKAVKLQVYFVASVVSLGSEGTPAFGFKMMYPESGFVYQEVN